MLPSPLALGFRDAGSGRGTTLDEDAESPMHYVAFTGRKEYIKELLKFGGDVNVKNSLGSMPLHKALEGGHQEVVETLIEAGADVNVPLLYGRTPLHFAAAMSQKNAAQSGASTGIRDMFGSTAYDVAVRYNHSSTAEALKPYEGTDDSASPVRGRWLLRRETEETEAAQSYIPRIPRIKIETQDFPSIAQDLLVW